MPKATIQQISSLLSMAGSAHHTYEQTVLQGVYDEEWPVWYANYVIDQGLNTLLGQPLDVQQLGQFLYDSYEVYKAEQSKQNWADYTAQKIAENWLNKAMRG